MSAIEYEGKILDIDVAKVTEAILAIGARQTGEYQFRRYVFDVVPARPGTWVRLRTNGQNTTLTVKEIAHDGVDGTSEWETAVDDFDTTLTILKKSGLMPKGYQENRRTEFTLGGALFAMDYWPQLQPYLEIEASDKATVEALTERLGFRADELVGDNTMKLYAARGIDLDTVAELKF